MRKQSNKPEFYKILDQYFKIIKATETKENEKLWQSRGA